MKWNKRMNLIARNTSHADCIEKHFLDSLTLTPLVDSSCSRPVTILDVGSGAGFPGLVLAVSLPEIHVMLLEPRLKRVSFLRHIIRVLSLANVEVVAQRLESMPELLSRKIDYVTSRAVAEPSVFLSMIFPFLNGHTRALLMMSHEHSGAWQHRSPVEGIIVERCAQFMLPFSGAQRTVCRVVRK